MAGRLAAGARWVLAVLVVTVRDFGGSVLGRSERENGAAAGKGAERGKVDGVSMTHLTQLQARCLLAACAFWAATTVVALPSCLFFGLLLLPAWGAAEAFFLVWWCVIYRRLNAQPRPHRPPAHEPARRVFDRFITQQKQLARYMTIPDMISKWHWGVRAEELTRGNVADLLCYGFWYRSQQQMADEGLGHLPEQLVRELEAAWAVTFPGGPHTPLPMMTHLWEPVRAFWRPLAFYAGIEVLICLKHVMLLAAGFRPHMHAGMRYYTYGLPDSPPPRVRTRRQAAAAAAAAPILFMHGVGLGLLPYLNFLLRLSCLGRPVVAVEVRHLSMRVCTEVPDEDEVVGRIVGALGRHGVEAVHAVAHSYGTFMASRLVQLHKPMVASLTLLDPVCMLMFTGKLIYNFVYRTPRQGASWLTWFISRDLAHAVSVSRRFYWSLLNLWADQLPDHTLVAMGARDELVPVKEVMTMLEAHPATRVLMHRHHRHADFIKDLPWQARMVQEVAELIAAASGGRVTHARSDSASSYEVMAGLGSSGGRVGGVKKV